jgi:2-oxo-hept-3-ene-1,7-dioate hydratase
MALSKQQITQAAQRLDAAEQARQQTGLMSLAYPDMTMADAYAIQAGWVAHKLGNGRNIVGHKIGLTSKAMQAALNIDIPDSGILFDDMLFTSGSDIPQDRFIQPRVEAEIAFVMKHDLNGNNVTVEQVIAATDYLVPSLEILDTRIHRLCPQTGVTRNVFDTIADNAANAGLVLGEQHTDPKDVDMRWVGAIVSANGEVEETGLGAGVLNQPALGIAWLAARLHEYGDSIKAGEIVLSGSFIRPIETEPGTLIEADFGDFGQVSCRF